MIWWHEKILKHTVTRKKVTVPMFDPSSKGLLVDCDCGKEWAL